MDTIGGSFLGLRRPLRVQEPYNHPWIMSDETNHPTPRNDMSGWTRTHKDKVDKVDEVHKDKVDEVDNDKVATRLKS